jgi:hypothetical protein
VNQVDPGGLCFLFSCKTYNEGIKIVSAIAGIASGFYQGSAAKLAGVFHEVADKLDKYLYVYRCGKALIVKSKPDFPDECAFDGLVGIEPEPAY